MRVTAVAVVGVLIASVFLAHNALVIHDRSAPRELSAKELARATKSAWEPARVTAPDGIPLEGWIFTPAASNGGGAILLHGVGDMRHGVMEHAEFLLRAGYTVLTPDARGHGASGGHFITYGIREADDLHAWADLLCARRPGTRLYGLGMSMGAAILIQALPREPRFRAAVADCPFASFEEVAYDRLHQASGWPRPAVWPVLNIGMVYARARLGVSLRDASPLAAIARTSTPVLLIHGVQDGNIPIRHSRELHAANPRTTELWEVPGADHVASLGVAGDEYVRRVLAWFAGH